MRKLLKQFWIDAYVSWGSNPDFDINTFVDVWMDEHKPEAYSNMEEKFEAFWQYYDKKRGKKKSKNLWMKLSASEVDKIREHLPLYIESTPDKQFRKDPEVYLRNECWEDEIIKPKVVIEKVDRL